MPVLDQPVKDSAVLVTFLFGSDDFDLYTYLEGFVEVDPNADITISGTRASFDTINRGFDELVYQDFGVDFFDTTKPFKHRFWMNQVDLGWTNGLVFHWALTNDIDDWNGLDTTFKNALGFNWYGGGGSGATVSINENSVGTVINDTSAVIPYGDHWVEIEFDPTVGTYGTLTARIYSDEYETLFDTLSLALTHQISFRYYFSIMSYNDGNTGQNYRSTGFTDGINLNVGTPTFAGAQSIRYTDWTGEIEHPIDHLIHTPVPSMDIKLPKYTGVLKETALKITLPVENDLFVNQIGSGEIFPETQVIVEEYYNNEDGTTGDFFVLFKGTVRKTIRNAQGRANRVRIECDHEKTRLDFTIGMLSTHHCVWQLGDANCDPTGTSIAIGTLREYGVASIVSGTNLTVLGLPTVADRYWQSGYVEFNGLRIKIRDWESGNIFKLTKPVPQEWLLRSIRLTPGCGKTQEICDATWSNLAHFNGNGYGIPAYHPIIERPA